MDIKVAPLPAGSSNEVEGADKVGSSGTVQEDARKEPPNPALHKNQVTPALLDKFITSGARGSETSPNTASSKTSSQGSRSGALIRVIK